MVIDTMADVMVVMIAVGDTLPTTDTTADVLPTETMITMMAAGKRQFHFFLFSRQACLCVAFPVLPENCVLENPRLMEDDLTGTVEIESESPFEAVVKIVLADGITSTSPRKTPFSTQRDSFLCLCQ